MVSPDFMTSLLETARRQGKDRIAFLVTLLAKPLAAARAAMFNDSA